MPHRWWDQDQGGADVREVQNIDFASGRGVKAGVEEYEAQHPSYDEDGVMALAMKVPGAHGRGTQAYMDELVDVTETAPLPTPDLSRHAVGRHHVADLA